MTRILVKDGDWAGARTKLKTDLESQHTSFQAKINAALGIAPPQAEATSTPKQSQTLLTPLRIRA